MRGFKSKGMVLRLMFAAGALTASAHAQTFVTAGDDGFRSGLGGAEFVFGDPDGTLPGNPPIPEDFFDPGSQAFEGVLETWGSALDTDPPGALGPTDTIVRRLADSTDLDLGPSDVGIEIVALSLVGTAPITVTYGGAPPDELWDVKVCLSDTVPAPLGTMTITKTCPDGGTFVAERLTVNPKFIFTRQSDGEERVLDCGVYPGVCGDLELDSAPDSVWALIDGPGGIQRSDFDIVDIPAAVDVDVFCDASYALTTLGESNFQGGLAVGCPRADAVPDVLCKWTDHGEKKFAEQAGRGRHKNYISSNRDDNGNKIPDVCEGADCQPDGTCKLGTENQHGPQYQGNDTKCGPTGACCLPNGSCTQGATEACCGKANGQYMGDGTTECPVPPCGLTITDVEVNLKGVSTPIGDIKVWINHAGRNTMEARFTVNAASKHLCQWVEFHWVQMITADVGPAMYEGAALPFPHMDPPKNGWDYMYTGPRLPGNINAFGEFFVDDQPWYYNAAGEARRYNICQTYDVRDTKTILAAPGTAFETWLVVKTGATEFCLVRGFAWSVSTAGKGPATDLGPPAGHAGDVEDALDNGEFGEEWKVSAKCDIENCSAVCKEGPPDETFAEDQEECHLQCADLCGGYKANVLSCFFKGINIKGNCDVVCKDETSDHIMLTKPTEEECHVACDEFCGGGEHVASCAFKGDTIIEKIPAVSQWGMIVMTLLVLAGLAIKFGRPRATQH